MYENFPLIIKYIRNNIVIKNFYFLLLFYSDIFSKINSIYIDLKKIEER